jgi:hypothetical protein
VKVDLLKFFSNQIQLKRSSHYFQIQTSMKLLKGGIDLEAEHFKKKEKKRM